MVKLKSLIVACAFGAISHVSAIESLLACSQLSSEDLSNLSQGQTLSIGGGDYKADRLPVGVSYNGANARGNNSGAMGYGRASCIVRLQDGTEYKFVLSQISDVDTDDDSGD